MKHSGHEKHECFSPRRTVVPGLGLVNIRPTGCYLALAPDRLSPGVSGHAAGTARPTESGAERDFERLGLGGFRRLVVRFAFGPQFGGDAGLVVTQFARGVRLAPGQVRGDELSHDRRRGGSAVRGLDGEPGPAGQHVIKVAGAFVSNRVDGLSPQVVMRAGQRLTERGIRLHQIEQLVDHVAVAVKQVLKAREMQAVLGRQVIAAVPQRQVAGCARERNAVGARRRHGLAESAGRFVYGLRGHDRGTS